jgi:fused signal recognition particle receptor
VARDWSDLFITGARAGEVDASASPASRRGLFRRLRENLSRTRVALGGEIQATLFGTLDEAAWERLEEALILADVGARTTASIVGTLEAEADAGELAGGEALSERLIGLLAQTASVGEARIDIRPQPTVILAVGVNGTGKTTTIGKLAWHLRHELYRTVLLGAADTFRAAAAEQLTGWAQRAGAEIVTARQGADPGAVAFEKHETLLTIDATTGQNGLRQSQLFAAAAGVSGVVLTKLDGTARGGIALAIAAQLQLPVKLIGIGETVEDLRPFNPEDFARALIAPE